MSADTVSKLTTDPGAVDLAIAQLQDKALQFAKLPPATKAQLLRECIARLVAEAPGWVVEGFLH